MDKTGGISILRRRVYLGAGLFLTGLGLVGLVTPVLPTTGFLVAASFLFARSSPRMHGWLRRNRILGPYLRAYTDKAGLSLGRKLGSIAFLWLGLGVSMVVAPARSWLLALLALVGIGVTLHLSLLRAPDIPARTPDKGGSFPHPD